MVHHSTLIHAICGAPSLPGVPYQEESLLHDVPNYVANHDYRLLDYVHLNGQVLQENQLHGSPGTFRRDRDRSHIRI